MVNIGWDYSSHPPIKQKGWIYMLAILQFIVKRALTLGTIFSLVFMVMCTVLVIVCVIRGDIKIKITRNGAEEKTNK